jgi:UDP-N-acetylglucosamine acyltransferase
VVEDDAIIGGLTGIHQFVRIGRMSILGGATKAVKDVPPYMTADGDPLKVYGPNKVGLERHGVSPETQQTLKQAYRIVFRSGLTTAQALERIAADLPSLPEVQIFADFIRSSERGIAR